EQLFEALTVFGSIDGVRCCSEQLDATLLERDGELERRLAAKLHDDAQHLTALRLFFPDSAHFFECQRLAVEPVAGIVVGRHGPRIPIDHDRLHAERAPREPRATPAVVERDASSYTCGTTA